MINQAALRHIRSKPDRLYEALLKAAREAEIPVPLMRVSLVATDAEGKETGRYEGWSRTYVRNFYNYLFGMLSNSPSAALPNYNDGFTTMKDTAGTIRQNIFNGQVANTTTGNTSAVTAPQIYFGATSGVNTEGIVIGTGTVPESFNSFALTSRLANGVGAGQMSYAVQTATTNAWNGTTRQFSATIVRIFNNNSGASITVTETACYADLFWGGANATDNFMLWRDLLASPVAVANGGQLTVTYTMVMQYPADVVNNPPWAGGAQIDNAIMQQQVTRNWHDRTTDPRGSPRDWGSTEQWQRQEFHQKNIP